MLNNPTLERLHELGLQGMAKAFVELQNSDAELVLAFDWNRWSQSPECAVAWWPPCQREHQAISARLFGVLC